MNSILSGKKKLSAFALVLGALLLCACPRVDPVDPVGPEGPDTPGPETPSGPYFNLLSTSDSFPIPPNHTVVYNRDATGSTFRVRTNIDDWKAVPSASWCTAHKDEQGNLVVLVEEYGDLATHETLPPRICRVSVEAGDVFRQDIVVVQQSWTFINIFPEPGAGVYWQPVQMPPSGGFRDVTVLTNAYEWVCSSNADWLKPECIDNVTLRITADPRPASETTPRRATVTLTVKSDALNSTSFDVADGDATLEGGSYGYDDSTDWD